MWRYILSKAFKYILLLLAAMGVVYWMLNGALEQPGNMVEEKPVILLYPREETEVHVQLETAGELTCTYPQYPEGGWHVTARPDGMLTDRDGRRYTSLFWEAEHMGGFDFSKGFCVKGSETAAFLEDILEEIGLNDRERCDFIQYWLPRMEKNPYNRIAFQSDCYLDGARLTVTPAPDSLLRVFMAWTPSETYVEMEPQVFAPFVRAGFTVVEWGGAQGK